MVDSYERAEKFTGNPGRDLLRKSMLSLSLTFFGAQHRQAHITSKGYHRYGEVLQQLNSHLTQPKQQLTDETLLTALSCMLLEVFRPTGATNFLKHQRGIDAIMQLRGPPTDSAGTSALIFRGLRILSIIGALAESRTSLFSRKEWKQAPPAETTEAGMLQHQIFDVLADCTKLISQRDDLLATGASREDFEPLVAETSTILRNLEDIHLRWESLNRSQLADTEIVSRVARELGVANHISATAYMLYNTVYICILQIKDSLCPSSDNTTLRNAAASKIARCLKLKAEEVREGALRSSTIAFVATKVAWQALGKFDSPEGRNLAYIVQSAMYGIFQEPCTKREAKTLTETPAPNKTFFA
ncbi:hypothetical protein BKA66DRAFT_611254 [Pyrenochaeta sp. MPI-SDFR-AT-0127]|nr:hypothetical protein BKA66DRAFT_611254 [Pyrenochaeta sp. MPI-SDFR-AT-0127]